MIETILGVAGVLCFFAATDWLVARSGWCYDAIYGTLTGLGYLDACTDYTERELALRYSSANSMLLQILDEIDDLQRDKMELVMKRDYELAVQKIDAAYVLQREVDIILFSSWSSQ